MPQYKSPEDFEAIDIELQEHNPQSNFEAVDFNLGYSEITATQTEISGDANSGRVSALTTISVKEDVSHSANEGILSRQAESVSQTSVSTALLVIETSEILQSTQTRSITDSNVGLLSLQKEPSTVSSIQHLQNDLEVVFIPPRSRGVEENNEIEVTVKKTDVQFFG